MERVEEIESMIAALPPDQFRRIAEWVRTLEEKRWDEQMDRDSAAGKLDFLFDEARGEADQGLLRDWPPEE
jgi:hypothetical protein